MRKGNMGLVPNPAIKDLAVTVEIEPEEEDDEARLVGGEPRLTTPFVLSPDDSRRLWASVQTKEPVVLTKRMKEAIANHKRIMSEVID